jgi:hypothetical protein
MAEDKFSGPLRLRADKQRLNQSVAALRSGVTGKKINLRAEQGGLGEFYQ